MLYPIHLSGILLVLLLNVGISRVYGQFLGGNGGGAQFIAAFPSICPVTAANPFGGGDGSGSSLAILKVTSCLSATANLYAGGGGTGSHAQTYKVTLCTIETSNPFAGSSGDGSSSQLIQVSVCPIETPNPFAGGAGNGSDFQRHQITNCPTETANPFAGGVGDGHHVSSRMIATCLTETANPFAGGQAGGHNTTIYFAYDPLTCMTLLLPVTVLSFEASCKQDYVALTWIAASQQDNAFFTIEKSRDGTVYEAVASVPGVGTSTEALPYQLTDPYPWPGQTTYRLSQTDLDGKTSPAALAEALCEGTEANVSVFPNPGHGSFVLRGGIPGEAFEVTNALGQVILSGVVVAWATELSLTDSPSGVYWVHLYSEARSVSRQAIKL